MAIPYPSVDAIAPRSAFPSEVDCDDSEFEPLNVGKSYDGSNVVFRLLRLESWGAAQMNLGYRRFGGPLAILNLLTSFEFAQRRLVTKSLELLGVVDRQEVLDIACGRGTSSFIAHCLHPRAKVVGLDLLDRNIQVARTLFDQIDNLSYFAGNSMALDFPDESFDRVMCLEAAFHFRDRHRFLHEAYRVLRPGGRLVVVDFAWNSDDDRTHRDDPEVRLVREVWQWDDMSSIAEYARFGRESGFQLLSSHDWSNWVTGPIQGLFHCLSLLGNSRWGRRVLQWRNPLYRSLSSDDWRFVARAVRAHEHARRYSKYMAFVFAKH